VLAVLQFDSASVALLARLLGAGELPTLAALRERGAWHDLDTPAEHFAAGAFHTLYSGTELGDHGLFYPFQWSAAEQRVRYMDAFAAPAPVWERLAAGGLRTLAIDPYESRPPRQPVDGVLVSGWQLRDRVVLRPWSRPEGARARLEGLFGPAPATEEVFGRPSASALLRLRRDLVAGPGRVADAAALLLAEQPFDLVWLTFGAAHVAGHQFWNLDQLGAQATADVAAVLGDARSGRGALAEVYRAVDAALARVLAALPPDADVLVVSPVGMDDNASRADLLPEMLAAVLDGGVAEGEQDDAAGAIWRLRAALPTGLRAQVAGALPDRVTLGLTARLELRGMDWARTRAFAQPADNQGYVRLNLAGRERDGIVAPGEAEALLEAIADGLRSFRDADGEPCVAAVDRGAGAYPGAAADRLPDLVVRWTARDATALDHVVSERYGTVRRRGVASGRSGNHTEGDAWALAIPGPGSEHRAPRRRARLTDVAATVAELLGVRDRPSAGEPLLTRR
jgi:predicted AlkP superfamily phosphohydrolase/phosphomutase